MENLRKSVTLVNNAEDLLKYTSNPTYITYKIFGKKYAAIHEIKLVLVLNKPIYVGFSVLELCKWLMYDFHYHFIKKDFDTELLFTDTDSLAYKTKLEDIYEEFFRHKHLFDFSNYPKDSKFFDETNKKVTGKMKDEFGGVIVDEFVGLKSKMYSMKKIDDKECNTAKRVSIAIEFNKFKIVLFGKKIIRHKMKRIQIKKHQLGTYEIDKWSLPCFEDTRYVLDGIYTLTYFHKNSVTSCEKIKNEEEIKEDCNKEDCNNWKRSWELKKIMIIEKECDKKNRINNKMNSVVI